MLICFRKGETISSLLKKNMLYLRFIRFPAFLSFTAESCGRQVTSVFRAAIFIDGNNVN